MAKWNPNFFLWCLLWRCLISVDISPNLQPPTPPGVVMMTVLVVEMGGDEEGRLWAASVRGVGEELRKIIPAFFFGGRGAFTSMKSTKAKLSTPPLEEEEEEEEGTLINTYPIKKITSHPFHFFFFFFFQVSRSLDSIGC